MSSESRLPPPYDVHAPSVLVAKLRKIQRQAAMESRGDEVLRAMRQIYQRLSHHPAGLGEPLYRLPALKMVVYCGVVQPLAVDFGICEDRPLVFLKDVRLLAKTG